MDKRNLYLIQQVSKQVGGEIDVSQLNIPPTAARRLETKGYIAIIRVEPRANEANAAVVRLTKQGATYDCGPFDFHSLTTKSERDLLDNIRTGKIRKTPRWKGATGMLRRLQVLGLVTQQGNRWYVREKHEE